MTLRHLFSKQKPTLSDHFESWTIFISLSNFLINSKSPEMMITPQWAHEIMQEFVYHFQDFCQYRAQVAHRSEEDKVKLKENKSAWSLSEVKRILSDLSNLTTIGSEEPIHNLMGYFSVVESARLDCLLGDYSASLGTIGPKKLLDRSELMTSVPTCHANAFYHAGICLLMSRKYSTVIEVLSEIILQITRQLKPGAAVLRQNVQQALQKSLDKISGLAAIAVVLNPGHRVDDQVLEIIDGKWSEKVRKMHSGEVTAFVDLFEGICPKFISPAYPDFSSNANPCAEAFRGQVANFSSETGRQISKVKIRSFLRLYSSIETKKMASLNDTSEDEFVSKLLAYKCRVSGRNSSISCEGDDLVVPQSDVHYYIDEGNLIIDSVTGKNDKSRMAERYFISGVRKHAEICNELKVSFAKNKL